MSTATVAAEPQLKMKDVITLTARLAQLLAEEVDFLSAMKVDKIEGLQQEKLFLINALDAQRKLVDRFPHLRNTISAQEKHDLEAVVKVFNNILAENHRKLQLAREVNYKIVQAITSVVKQNTQSRVYNVRGHTGYAPYETLSVTLNKRI
jgi:hypothetical protein